jgi:protein gp37
MNTNPWTPQYRRIDWTGEVRLVKHKLADPLKREKPTRYFVNSMSDVFHPNVSNEIIAAVFGVMAACPQHFFIVLTKRAKRMREWFGWISKDEVDRTGWAPGQVVVDHAVEHVNVGIDPFEDVPQEWPLPNVALGVSVSEQKDADELVPLLLQTPAVCRIISAKPLLGPTDLFAAGMKIHGKLNTAIGERAIIHQVLTGGESGPGARPCHPDWIRSLRDQCAVAGVPFYFKGWGAWIPTGHFNYDLNGSEKMVEIGNTSAFRVGKKRSGNLLDGQRYEQFPEVILNHR